ncbi:MAG: transglycosylase SLT domain-containing protein, partial [Chloroflexota bacterium]
EDDIVRWSQEYNLDPNLLATVMQIESCGHPTVNSPAGAQGLFQVMPMHFDVGANMLDPDTNAMEGAGVLNDCIGWASGDIGLAMACYNGGPSVIQKNPANWYAEVKRYYAWGVPIYADALVGKNDSETLSRWMNAGGSRLCNSASSQLGLR